MFEGISKNVTAIGFYDNGQFMYSGGEDHTARIWDLRMGYGYGINVCVCVSGAQSTILPSLHNFWLD